MDEMITSRVVDLKHNEEFKKGIRRLIKHLAAKPATKAYAAFLDGKVTAALVTPITLWPLTLNMLFDETVELSVSPI